MRWLRRLMAGMFNGKAHRVQDLEERTEQATREAERVRRMVENYRRAQDALRR